MLRRFESILSGFIDVATLDRYLCIIPEIGECDDKEGIDDWLGCGVVDFRQRCWRE